MMCRRRLLWVALALLVGIATGAVVLLKDHVLVRNFHAVEAGQMYRGAEQKPGPFRSIIRRYGIRTILCLAEPERDERAAAQSLGVHWVFVRLDGSSAAATFDDLEKAAGILADPTNRPVFFHCKRGVYRSNLAQAVYRMKSCGWSVKQALDELRTIGYDPERSGGDNSCAEFLARYYRERIQEDTAIFESMTKPIGT